MKSTAITSSVSWHGQTANSVILCFLLMVLGGAVPVILSVTYRFQVKFWMPQVKVVTKLLKKVVIFLFGFAVVVGITIWLGKDYFLSTYLDKELEPRQAQLLLREKYGELDQLGVPIESSYVDSDGKTLVIVLRKVDPTSISAIKKAIGKRTNLKVIEGYNLLD